MNEEKQRNEELEELQSPRGKGDSQRSPGRDEAAVEGGKPSGGFPIDMGSLTEEDVREMLEKARKGEDLLERLQILQAEHENYRKRMAKEAAKHRLWAVRDFVCELLPAVDNLERALESGKGCEGDNSIREGVEMVLEMIRSTLLRHGIRRIDAVGRTFDPAFHEASGYAEVPGAKPGTVVSQLLQGYVLDDMVVRASRVLVAKPSDREGGSEHASAGEDSTREIDENPP